MSIGYVSSLSYSISLIHCFGIGYFLMESYLFIICQFRIQFAFTIFQGDYFCCSCLSFAMPSSAHTKNSFCLFKRLHFVEKYDIISSAARSKVPGFKVLPIYSTYANKFLFRMFASVDFFVSLPRRFHLYYIYDWNPSFNDENKIDEAKKWKDKLIFAREIKLLTREDLGMVLFHII